MNRPYASAETLFAHAERALARAKAAGADVADACLESSRAFTVSVLGGRIETLKQSGSLGLGLRVVVNGAVGFCSGTDLSPEGLDDLARRAVALSRHATPDEANGAPTPAEAGGDAGGDLDILDPAAIELPVEQKIEMALELERIVLGTDARIGRTDGASVSSSGGVFAIANSHGLARAWEGSSVSASVIALADDRDRQQTGWSYSSQRHLADLPAMEALAREAATRALARLGGRPVPAARVPVVMSPDVASAWISDMYDAFSAESVLQQSSWLAGKLGETIASPAFSLVDDGTLRRGLGSSPYDCEGARTRRNVLVDTGRLAMFAYDHYHAKRAGVPGTANGVRGYSSTPGIGFHNLFVVPGERSPEEIVRSLDRAFWFDESGSFGYNPVSGDYSYQAQGFWIEKGEKAFPVDGVTVAGRSLDMLRNVTAVGNDLVFRSSVAAPTLLIGEMTLSGA